MIPFRGGIDCERCRQGLDRFIGEVLEGNQVPRDSPILLHLQGCPRCSETYIHLIDLLTAPQVQGLQESQLSPSQVPDNLEGLLLLWEIQLAACNRLEDLRGCAVGLSVIGMIRRELGHVEDARLVHELALQTAEEGDVLLSKAMSHADLGAIALRDGRATEAQEHLSRAHQCATQLADRESEARLLVLLGDAWRMQGNVDEARRSLKEAEMGAAAVDYHLAREMAGQRIRSLSAAAYWQETKRNWKRLQTEIQITIAEMKAGFRNWPGGLQPQPATVAVRYRLDETESWSLHIPEEEGQAGYDVELTVSSPSGQRVELGLALVQQPGGGPLAGAEVLVYDDVGLPLEEEPRISDEKGRVAVQLWPGKHTMVIGYQGARREIPLEVLASNIL